VFERAFKDFGLPLSIRTDNGIPFASPSAFFGLSRLSVWWLRLGIGIERIKPGNPQQNGRDERMHLTLKKEATKPPAKNLLQQQEVPSCCEPGENVTHVFRIILRRRNVVSPHGSQHGGSSEHGRKFARGSCHSVCPESLGNHSYDEWPLSEN
jgi:transposase InsO family protein